MSSVQDRIAQSASDFRSIVWPHLAESLGGGELVPVETVTDSEFARLLDTLGMTDAWQVVQPNGMRSLATRVQWGGSNWRSWTVRCELPSGNPTEWHKLTQDGSWQLPQYIVQAYLDQHGGRLIEAAAIKTSDLQMMLASGWHGDKRRNPQDGTRFIPVWWSDAVEEQMEVFRVP